MLLYDHIQAYIDAIRMHVPKAKYDYTGRFAAAGREQFMMDPEIWTVC